MTRWYADATRTDGSSEQFTFTEDADTIEELFDEILTDRKNILSSLQAVDGDSHHVFWDDKDDTGVVVDMRDVNFISFEKKDK